MGIVVVGIDHARASIDWRERLTCPLGQRSTLLRAAQLAEAGIQENVLLSTCNRFEWYAVCPDVSEGRAALLRALSETRQVALADLELRCSTLCDEQAVSHLFSVTCGLYSQVPGEAQIQGQVAEALELALSADSVGPLLSALFRAALVTGKRARSETGISRHATSMSHIAIHLARRFFPRLAEVTVLLVGAGQMSKLAASSLCDIGVKQLLIVSRTDEHAMTLAQCFHAAHRPFEELPDALQAADVVISSTSAPHTIITSSLTQQVMERRAERPLLLIDLALPRDIDPAAATVAGVQLYNLDDLQATVDENIRLRRQEVAQAQLIIAEEVEAFERWSRSLGVIDTIRDLRGQVEGVRQRELARTMRLLASSLSDREQAYVEELTTRLVNKLLHGPTLRLKAAAAAGQGQIYVEALRYLFNLKEGESMPPAIAENLGGENVKELPTDEDRADILYG
ncbi:MAG TPA: glutamyl-tRNA reductase [Ktedonosporobacter sp.]|nr:glutamyl-tRNA reductase [Ktedonosporobacter sp.]